MPSTPPPCPDVGDLIWLDFTPQAGREQRGRRPALVLTPREQNRKSGLAVVVPITSACKGYPFEVAIPDGLPVSGVILSDQVRSLDWGERRAEIVGRLPSGPLWHVQALIARLLGLGLPPTP